MTKKKKQHSIPGQYLVIPLSLTEKPFATNDIEAYRNTSHYIVKLDSLKTYNNIPDDEVLDIEAYIIAHVETVKKIQIKDMGKYGNAAFSKAIISEGDKLIYSGLVSSMPEGVDQAKYIDNQHLYTIRPSKYSKATLLIDGNFNECLSKYLQHMPLKAADYIINDGKKSCHANFETAKLFCRVRIYGMKLNIPIIVLRATHTIQVNKMITFDYGADYWLKRPIAPTYFTEDGEALTSFHFICESKPQIIEQSFSADALEQVVEEKYHIENNLIIIYPPESIHCINAEKNGATTGAIRIKVPAMVGLEIDETMMIANQIETGHKLFLLPIKHYNFQLDEFLKPLTIGAAEMGGVWRFSLIVERILNLSVSEWLYLADFLNKIVVRPVEVYKSEIYKQLTLPIVQETSAIPLYSATQATFFKRIAANFNDKHSALEVTMRTPRV